MTERLPEDCTILALETSCDETAVAIVRNGTTILSNIVASQMDMHQRYGGIVPEVASRQHMLSLTPVVQQALAMLPDAWSTIDAIAATYGPGLSGALLVGLNAAKAIAWQRNLPFIGVNHLEAHIYANWLAPDNQPYTPPTFPLVALIVSGGHTLLVVLNDHGDYYFLGQTRDDAAGEAFDKVARIMGLGYPGGPALERATKDVQKGIPMPRAWLRDSYDFSFSGLKTAVLHTIQEAHVRQPPEPPTHQRRGRRATAAPTEFATPDQSTPAPVSSSSSPPPSPAPAIPHEQFIAQVAYGFQESVVDVLVTKTIKAAKRYEAREIVLAGGVAANKRLREELTRRAEIPVRCPPISLCTDNAAMVAAAAYYRFKMGIQHGLDLDVHPNLRLV